MAGEFEMTKFDYEFLTGTWDGPYGAAYNTVMEDCKNSGLYSGWGYNGTYPMLTEKGRTAIIRYLQNKDGMEF